MSKASAMAAGAPGPLGVAATDGVAGAVVPVGACTSLAYVDAHGRVYFGRTMELTFELPYQVAYFPAGQAFRSQADGHAPLDYTSTKPILAITMPFAEPRGRGAPDAGSLKVVDGLNADGLTFSVLAYPSAKGPADQADATRAVLAVSDLGTWALGQFASVGQVKAALAGQPAIVDRPKLFGGKVQLPFHYVLHDRTGASIVIEYVRGEQRIHDNPVGVMTNGPEFEWHLTNLANYTFLSNVDQPTATFGKLTVAQPDSGIATAGLPSSNTSVGRFVRAAFYAQHAEKVDDPDAAVRTLAHVMNNFDRPRNITVDARAHGEGDALSRLAPGAGASGASEYTSWTVLADLERGLLFLRTYDSLSYVKLDLRALVAASSALTVLPATSLAGQAQDGTATLLGARSAP